MITDAINKLPYELRERAREEYNLLINKVQNYYAEGNFINREKIDDAIKKFKAFSEYKEDKDFSLNKFLRYHIYKKISEEKTIGSTFFDTTLTENDKYITYLDERIEDKSLYRSIRQYALENKGRVYSNGYISGFIFADKQNILNFLNTPYITNDYGNINKTNTRTTNDAEERIAELLNRPGYRTSSNESQNPTNHTGNNGYGLHQRTDRRNDEGEERTSTTVLIEEKLNTLSNYEYSEQSIEEQKLNIQSLLLLPEYVNIDTEYKPGVSSYDTEKHRNYVISNHIKLHLEELQKTLSQDLHIASEKTEATVHLYDDLSKGSLEKTINIWKNADGSNSTVNLFIHYKLDKTQSDIQPIKAITAYIERDNDIVLLNPPFYYQDFLSSIKENFLSEEQREYLSQVEKDKNNVTSEDEFTKLKQEHNNALILYRKGNRFITNSEDREKLKEIIGFSSFAVESAETYFPKIVRSGLTIHIEDNSVKTTELDFGGEASAMVIAQKNISSSNEDIKITAEQKKKELEQAKQEGREEAKKILATTNNTAELTNIAKSKSVSKNIKATQLDLFYFSDTEQHEINKEIAHNNAAIEVIKNSIDTTAEEIEKDSQLETKTILSPIIETETNISTENQIDNTTLVRQKEEPLIDYETLNKNNYVATGTDPLELSIAARIHANCNAIELVQELEEQQRTTITAEERAILGKYTGWGGLSEAFNSWKRFGDSYKKVSDYFINQDDYEIAQNSVHTAYYTPLFINKQLWEIAQLCGFKGGKILEGSAGTGAILSVMPSEYKSSSSIQAVEIDNLSSKILKYLYPGAQVEQKGFEKTIIRNESVDLAITNVPFATNYKVYDPVDKDLSSAFSSLHDFCIAKNIRKLKQGGIGIFLTSANSLDKSHSLRQWIVSEGNSDVIGAYRLNTGLFKGTTVTTDVIVVKKRTNGIKSNIAIDVSKSIVVDKKTIGDRFCVKQYNQYFVNNPQMLSGTMEFGADRNNFHYGGHPVNLYPPADTDSKDAIITTYEAFKNDLQKRLAEENIIKAEDKIEIVQAQSSSNSLFAEEFSIPENTKIGSLVLNAKNEICLYCVDPYNNKVRYLSPLNTNNNKINKKYTKQQCLADYNKLKNSLNALIDYQKTNKDDSQLSKYLIQANRDYDTFYSRYGQLNKNNKITFLRKDVDFATVAATEDFSIQSTIVEDKETGEKIPKTEYVISKDNIYKKRVINVEDEPTIHSVNDALILSYQRYREIKLDFMSVKLQRDVYSIQQELLDNKLAFRDPDTDNLVIRHEYLSGNVRYKLNVAELYNEDGKYSSNIASLSEVLPITIPLHLIEINLGCSWIPTSLYSTYIKEKYDKDVVLVNLNGRWHIKGISKTKHDILHEGTTNINAGYHSNLLGSNITGMEIFMAAINNKSITISSNKDDIYIKDEEGEKVVVNMIDDTKINFAEWVKDYLSKNEDLRDEIETLYNNNYNNYVPMTIDESFLPKKFIGQTKELDLYKHQKSATIRGTMQSMLLAHEVGTGKTFTLISSAMEMKRLGTAKKPMIVVQNATNTQFVNDAKRLYPGAKILSLEDKDNTREGRHIFFNKIRYNDWDMVIVPHSVLNMIPDSLERQQNFITEQVNELVHVISKAENIDAEATDIANLNRKLDTLNKDLYYATEEGQRELEIERQVNKALLEIVKEEKEKAEKNNVELSKDDIKRIKDEHRVRINNKIVALSKDLDRRTDKIEFNFDDLGIDALLIDEAHNYKRLGYSTSIPQGVKGIDPAQSQKAISLFLKIQSIYERSGGKNIILATGTPISNTCAELWTFLRYLSNKSVLQSNNIHLFDEFVQNYGLIRPELEFTATGKFKQVNRLGSYTNIPELMRIWQQYTDTVLTEEVEYINDKVPKMKNDKPSDVYLEPVPITRLLNKKFTEKGEWFENLSKDEKKLYRHVPLCLYGLAKRACIDPRLIIDVPDDMVKGHLPDGTMTKTQATIDYTLKALEDTKYYRGTIAIFCDNYQRSIERNGKKEVVFNLFEEIKNELVSNGIPKNEIHIMKPGMPDSAKENVFNKVKKGEIRVILGTTALLGTGVNIQERLYSVIHMDAPVRPMDYEQRNGRILRQGNLHKEWGLDVDVVRFGVIRTMDTTAYQVLKNKEKFVRQVMNNKQYLTDPLSTRVIEEESTDFDRPTAVLSGSQYYIIAEQAKKDYNRMLAKEKQHNNNQIYYSNKLRTNQAQIRNANFAIAKHKDTLEQIEKVLPNGKPIEKFTYKDQIIEIPKDSNILSLLAICEDTTTISEDGSLTLFEKIEKKEEQKSILSPIIQSINKEITERMKLMRDAQEAAVVEMRPFKININDNIEVILNMKLQGSMQLSKEAWKYEISRTLTYNIPSLEMYSVPVYGHQVKNAIEDIMKNVLTGGDAREKVESLQNAVVRMEKEINTIQPLIGVPFADKDNLEKAKKNYEKYSELAKKEIAENKQKNDEALKDIPDIKINIDELLKISGSDDESSDYAEFQTLDFNVYHASTREEDIEIAFELLSTMRKSGIDVQLTNEDVNYYGRTQDDKIIINTREINFETPIHEYSHMWCKSMQKKNPELWKEIRDNIMELHLLKYPDSAKTLSLLSEEKQELAKNLAASELIARYSGRSGAIKLHNEYKKLKEKGHKGDICNKVFTNVLNSLNKFWNWTAKNIFGKKENNTFDVIADTILGEMLSGVNVIHKDIKQEEKVEKTKNEINDKPLEKHIKEIISKKKHRGFKM